MFSQWNPLKSDPIDGQMVWGRATKEGMYTY